MKKYITTLLLIVSIIGTSFGQLSQEQSLACKTTLRQFYKAMDVKIDDKKTVSYKYKTKVELKDKSATQIPEQTSAVVGGKGKLYFTNPLSEMYQDDKDVVVVMHVTKEVIRMGVPENNNSAMNLQIMQAVMDTLVAVSDVIAYTELNDEKGNKLKKIQIQIPNYLVEETQIKTITYWVDDNNKFLSKIKIDYTKDNDIKSLTNTYFDLKEDVRLDNQSAYLQVFDKNDQLLNKYKGYTLIDQRQ